MLAEKAYAKLNGTYAAIVGGHENEALQDLTGGVPINIKLSPPDARLEQYQGTVIASNRCRYIRRDTHG